MVNSIFSIIIGYVFGCFLTAVFVAKRFTGKDISEIGTGNPGMANTMAQIGKKAGFIVLGGDILKTVIAMALAAFIFRDSLGTSQALLWSGFGALLGHNFPITRRFKGGKGVTVTCTWIILLLPFSGIVSAVGGGLVVLLTGLLPLGAVLITFFFIPFSYFELGRTAMYVMVASFLIMLFRHFPGFIRGFKNQEKREFKKKRSVASVFMTILVILGVYVIGFGRYYFLMNSFQGVGPVEVIEEESEESEEAEEPAKEPEIEYLPMPELNYDEDAGNEYDFTIGFAGDINFDEGWSTTQYMNSCANGIYDCIDEVFINKMNEVDIMWINNEFTYSTQGSPMEGKAYTFRANPERVENLHILGVDIVGLANNHVYDYGKQALLDTFETLDSAGIPYIGAGRNIEEAMKPYSFEIQGKTVAFVAASRAEKNKMTPQATDEQPGILRCYDTTLFDEAIREADEKYDFVIALPHWGTEYSTTLENVQLSTAREYLDAGADAVVGAHTHCLQGFEYYDGKPIAYSLGNFWFNEKTLDTMLLTMHFFGNDDEKNVEMQLIPGLQKGYTTSYVADATAQRELYDRLEEISVNVDIDADGRVVGQ